MDMLDDIRVSKLSAKAFLKVNYSFKVLLTPKFWKVVYLGITVFASEYWF